MQDLIDIMSLPSPRKNHEHRGSVCLNDYPNSTSCNSVARVPHSCGRIEILDGWNRYSRSHYPVDSNRHMRSNDKGFHVCQSNASRQCTRSSCLLGGFLHPWTEATSATPL